MNSTTSYSRTMNGLTDIVADSVTTDTLVISNLSALDIVCNTLNAATSVTTDTLLSSSGTLAIGSKVSQSTNGSNVSYGINSMNGTQTGTENTSIGSGSSRNLTSANQTTAVGALALNTSTTGGGNTAIGYRALFANNSVNNTALGSGALSSYTGSAGTAVGYLALTACVNGTSNNAFGLRCLESLVSSSANTGMGQQALRYLTTGQHNTATGFSADINQIGGGYNCFYGSSCGHSVTWGTSFSGNCGYGAFTSPSGNNNTLIGYQAGTGAGRVAVNNSTGLGYLSTPTASSQIMLGTASEYVQCPNYMNVAQYITTLTQPPLTNNTRVATTQYVDSAIAVVGGVSLSANNIFTGFNTFANKVSAYNDTVDNLSYGANAMALNTNNGSNNHAFGINSGYALGSTATNNTYLGCNTGSSNVSGNDCVFIGNQCGSSSLTNNNTIIGSDSFNSAVGGGADNVGLGYGVLKNLTTAGGGGYRNVSIGSRADEDLTTGSLNVSIGYLAGAVNPSYATGTANVHIGAGNETNGGSNNVSIGFQLVAPTITTNYSTAIGYNAKCSSDYQIALGTASEYIQGFNYMLLPTPTENTNNTKVATTEYADRAVSNMNDYNKTITITDDFLTGLTHNPVDWDNGVTSGGTGAIATSSVNHPGIYRFATSTTVGSSSGLVMNQSSIFTDNLTTVEWIWKYNTNFNNSVIQVGYANAFNVFTVSAVFRLQISPGSYQAVVSGTPVFTFSATGLTGLLVNTWLHGKIVTDFSAGTQIFTLTNLSTSASQSYTHTAAVTSSAVTPICKISQLGTTASAIDMDYCRFKYITTSRA